MKWNDAMRQRAAELYGQAFREVGELAFWGRHEEIKAEIHWRVEGETNPKEHEMTRRERPTDSTRFFMPWDNPVPMFCCGGCHKDADWVLIDEDGEAAVGFYCDLHRQIEEHKTGIPRRYRMSTATAPLPALAAQGNG